MRHQRTKSLSYIVLATAFLLLVAPLACHDDRPISSAGVGESGGGLGRTGAGASGGSSSSGNMDRPGGGTRGGLTGTGGTDERTRRRVSDPSQSPSSSP